MDIFDEVYNDLKKRFPDGISEAEYIPTIVSIDRAYDEDNALAVAAIAKFTGKDYQAVDDELTDNWNYDGYMTQKQKLDASDEDAEIMRRYMDVYCGGTREVEGEDIQADAIKAVKAINATISDEMKALVIQHTPKDQNPFFPTILVVSQTLFDLGHSIFSPHARFQDDTIHRAGYKNLLCSNFILVSPEKRL